MEIDCGSFVLRPWHEWDQISLVAHANDREIARQMRDRFPHPYTLDDARAWIACNAGRTPPTHFAIVVDGAAAGSIGLEPGSDIARLTAEIGYWLGRAAWGRGITTRAVRELTAYAFERLGLERVFALPFASNLASIRVLENAGYRREGVMRASAIKDGRIVDQVLLARVRADQD